jgi:hypothetical protein
LMLASLVLEQCLRQFVFSSLRLLAVNTPRLASKIFYQDQGYRLRLTEKHRV